MRNKLLLSLLLLGAIVQAQVVNIPDANFKSYLVNYDNGQTIDINQDGEIQVSEALAIESLDISPMPWVNFTSLQGIEAFTNLLNLSIQTPVASINLSGLSQLDHLMIIDPLLTELNLSGLTNLFDLQLQMVQLTSLDISGLTGLHTVFVEGNALTTLNIGNLNELYGMWVISDSLSSLDYSGCPLLSFVHLTLNNEDKDVYINLKNGNPVNAANSTAIYLNSWEESPYNAYVCVDEGEVEYIEYMDEDVVFSTYCSFTPGGDYNTIAGNLTFSNDASCAVGMPVATIPIQINDGTETGTTYNSTGNYNFYTQAGTFTITPQFENDWFTATPASATVNFADNNNNAITQNFCITPNGVHPDVEVVILPTLWANPGFDASYQIIYRNKGNQTLSGEITFTFNDAVLDYVSASPSETSSSTGSLTWSYTGLMPFETREVYVVLNLNSPMETPPVVDGDEITFTASVTPSTTDETPQDNSFVFEQIVSGSFDPNDITCLEGDVVAPEKIGEYLHYNINFENTGTAPATFIVIKDIINEEQFDVSTLQLMQASHDVEVRVQDNKVEFYFDDIQLGPLEKGNVVFKIKTLNTLQENDDVTQQAEIFFDYNWPIVTNEATTVFQTLGMGDFVVDSSIKIYPNPSEGIINLSADNNITSVQLYDVQGRLLQAVNPDDITVKMDISARIPGIYFININTAVGVKTDKVVKK